MQNLELFPVSIPENCDKKGSGIKIEATHSFNWVLCASPTLYNTASKTKRKKCFVVALEKIMKVQQDRGRWQETAECGVVVEQMSSWSSRKWIIQSLSLYWAHQ